MIRRAAILAAVLLLLPGTARAGKSTEELVAEFAVPRTRAAALAELRRRKDPAAVPLLVQALPDCHWLTQYYGTLLLYQYRSERALEGLRTLGRARSPFLRFMSGYYRHVLRDEGVALVIADALSDPEATPALLVQMLARVGAVRSGPVDAAVASLLSTRTDADVLILCHAIAAAEGFGRYATASRRHLDHEDPTVRALAAALLVRHGYEEYAKALAGELRDALVPAAQWPRLHAVLAAAPRLPKVVLSTLADRVVAEENPEILRLQLILLGRHPYPPARDAILGRLAHDDATVASAAFDAILALPGAATKERLLPFLVAKRDAGKLRAADALRRLDDHSGLRVAIDVLADGAPADRAEAARVLGGFVTSATVDPLIGALADAAPAVRSEAATQLVDVLTRLFPYRRFNLARAGYDPAGPPAGRDAAIETVRQWWKDARTRDW